MTTTQNRPRIDTAAMPAQEADTLARVSLSAAARAVEDPEVAADYKHWKQQRKPKGEKA